MCFLFLRLKNKFCHIHFVVHISDKMNTSTTAGFISDTHNSPNQINTTLSRIVFQFNKCFNDVLACQDCFLSWESSTMYTNYSHQIYQTFYNGFPLVSRQGWTALQKQFCLRLLQLFLAGSNFQAQQGTVVPLVCSHFGCNWWPFQVRANRPWGWEALTSKDQLA